MSFRKFSQGCGECRKRKIKCDLQQPQCARCLKSARRCPGYRDQNELQFRNETQAVIQLAKAGAHVPPSTSRRTSKSLIDESLKTYLNSQSAKKRGHLFLLPIDSLVINAEHQASCFFLTNYTWIGSPALIHGVFDYRVDSAQAPLGERALLAGVTAVGKATVGNINKSSSLIHSARSDYSTSLRLTNAAVSAADQWNQDSTLVAIFLLSLFEVITGYEEVSIDNWLQHINGSVKLLEMRGVDGLMNTPSLTTFRAWRDQIILGCIYRRVPVPPTIIRLSARLATASCSSIETSSNQLTLLMARLSELRYHVASGLFDNDGIILKELSSIESGLSIWLKQVSPSCAYKSFAISDIIDMGQGSSLHPYRGLCHRYPDLSSALMWNNYRITRILVYDMILSQLRPLATMRGYAIQNKEAQTKCSEMRKEMRKLADEICYSAPDILGVLDLHASNSEPSQLKSSAGGFVLLFPLSFAVVVDDHPSSLSEWVFECFRVIAGVMGIHQALVLRKFLPTLCGQHSWADTFHSFQECEN
ncbi:hypothetical protein BGW36DRAFT_90199 [Talaromyces proteolyticus]|uniref:Zn(2)-C6 fungal-type domain-containing protein n=1 Tax=Talaromyces proteolyticus TaxID=1131652 RepID=A0AAD4Q4W4_9EURO|nr:uncharacterized protein BGW36DRAFT_90199 [Talaromyces proteolyticus]KAH8703686.1 hypothetical protein BGW36DRAFT_90199 [Talaromyces proteolyticus]